MVRKTKSIRVDDELWRKTKIYAINTKQKLGDLIEKLLRKELADHGTS